MNFNSDSQIVDSRVAQWKRAGPITQRSEDRNLALLNIFFFFNFFFFIYFVRSFDLKAEKIKKIQKTILSQLKATKKDRPAKPKEYKVFIMAKKQQFVQNLC